MTRPAMLWVLSCALALVTCGTPAAGPSEADEATMAALGTVRALHHEADVYEATGDYARAIHPIRRILAMQLPAAMQESEDVRADAFGRLAELVLHDNNPQEALNLTETGLREARRETVLRARLFLVRGQVLAELATRAEREGRREEAERRRTEALAAFETSIEVNQRILGRLTDAGPKR
jgi:tetratricopeptide (TPR) repeat protein